MLRKNFSVFLLFWCAVISYHSCAFDQLTQNVIPDDNSNPVVDTSTTTLDTSIIKDPTSFTHKCDPDSVYFEKDILPILNANCSTSGCHSASSRRSGVITDSYTKLVQTVSIKPFNPSQSRLYISITQKNRIMPPSGRMSDDKINLISKWISQGALNSTCNP